MEAEYLSSPDEHHDMTDAQWDLLRPLLPGYRSGPFRRNGRQVLDGIFFVFRERCSWRSLPERYGPYRTVYNRFKRWSRDGTWAKIQSALQGQAGSDGDDSDSLDSKSVSDDKETPDGDAQSVGIRERFEAISPYLNERSRRLLVAAEARSFGYGGVQLVSEMTGVAHSTIARGLKDLDEKPGRSVRVRRKGGGRKPKSETQPELLEALDKIINPAIHGDPERPLKWVSKSLRHIAKVLSEQGFKVSHSLVSKLLKQLGYTLQSNRKTREGAKHPDRDKQFHYINDRVNEFMSAGQPVISVDTKKKELIGDFKNAGREWRPKGSPEEVNMHDFADKKLGKASPYGYRIH